MPEVQLRGTAHDSAVDAGDLLGVDMDFVLRVLVVSDAKDSD